MNLNQMNMDEASDAAIRISSALSFVLEDKEVKDLFKDMTESKGTALMDWVPKYLPKIANIALKRHKESLYEIIGALTQKDAKEVGKMNFFEALSVLQENWKVLSGFFTTSNA